MKKIYKLTRSSMHIFDKGNNVLNKILFLIVTLIITFPALSQDGPGGVGNLDGTGVIKLWLDADSATVDVSDEVTAWDNLISVTELNMTPTTANNPNFVSSKFNGHAAVSFENVDDALGSASVMDYSYFPEDEATTFTVTQHDNLSQKTNTYATEPLEGNRFSSHMPWNGTIYHDLGDCCGTAARVQYTYDPEWLTEGSILAWRSGGGYNKEALRNNVSQVTGNTTTSTFVTPENYNFEIGQTSTNTLDNFQGDVAEFLMYNAAINDAQMTIVHNYLAAKYNLTITDDFYLFQTSHGVEVIGIGRNGTEEHTESKSSSIFTIKGASALDDGDYIFTGHDNSDASSWTTSEQINSDTNLERIAREWRFDVSGDPGTITMSIDPTDLPAFNTDFGFYTLWIDDDGDFTSGATQYPLTLNSGEYEATGVTVTDGMFVTIGAYKPEINFIQSAFSGKENAGDAVFEISIDYAVDAAVTVNYTVSGTCTEDLPSAGTFTIPVASTSTTLNVPVTSGDTFESDETIILTLTAASQSHGILGASAVSTYTVKDDGTNATNTIQYDAPFSYDYKKTITINKDMVSGSTDLVDFPVMIRIDGADFTEMEPNIQSPSGYDIRFTYANSVEWLEHQIELFDAVGDEYIAWVKIPSLSASVNTEIDVYYGNALIGTDPSVSTVFGTEYEAVLHLEDATDAGSKSNDGTLLDDASIDPLGKIGSALSLDGSNDALSIPNSADVVFTPTEEMTMSFWYKGTDNQATYLGMSDRDTGAPSLDGYEIRTFDTGRLGIYLGQDILNQDPGVTTEAIRYTMDAGVNEIDDDVWHYITITYDGTFSTTGIVFYIDGVVQAVGAGPTDNMTATSDMNPGTDFLIGGRSQDGVNTSLANEVVGLFDEVRLARKVVDGDWVGTEYNNMNDDGTLINAATAVATSGFQVAEATDAINLTVALASVDANDVSVDYAVTSGTASSGSDYTLVAGTITITAGNLSALIAVDLSDDAVDELDETFIVSLSNPVSTSDVSLGTNDEIEITLLDDDDGPVISATDAIIYVNEGSDINEFSVDLTAASQRTVTIDYTVTAISAISGSDYLLSDGTLTFPIDSTSTQGTFNLIDDIEVETVESFTIQLSNPNNATLDGVLDEITVFINDNDNFGIDGPGGVGDADGTGTLVMWMIADSVTNTGDGTSATFWPNEIDITNLDLNPIGTPPTYEENIANGHAAVSFDAGTNDEMRSSSLSTATFPYNEGAVFLVTTHDNQTQQSVIYGTRGNGTRFNSHMPWNGTAYFDIGTCCAPRVQFTYDNDWVGEPSLFSNVINSTTGQVVHRNGIQVGADGDIGTVTNHSAGTFGLGLSSIDDFAGDIMEFIMYTSPVNEAQRIITENYLAAKYDLALTNDFYAFETTHSTELVGIGQEDSDNYHAAAQTGLITISNASTLGDGDYVFIGHDNTDKSAWTTTDIPSDVSNIQRIAREYRSDIVGSPGTISIAIDASQLPTLPTDYTQYVLLADDDGVFNNDASIYPMTLVDGEYVANTVAVAQGTYFSIGTHQRTIEFSGSSIQDFENVNNSISLSLSLASGSDISIPYTIAGTATNGTDYTIAATGSFTISAGNTVEVIDLGILDESVEETDETIIVTLGTAPAGTVLGTNSIFTYTINDDDNDRSIIIDHFTSYRDITISSAQVTGSHTDFPVLISFAADANLSQVAGSMESTNGYDIAFYDSLNGVWLDHELEYYNDNGATADLSVWVKIPSLTSSADVDITMFYGNTGVVFDQSNTDTWNSDFAGVWHMDVNDPNDATSNGANGTNQGGTDIGGQLGRASFFNGSSNLAVSNIASVAFDLDDSYTISFWYKGTDTNNSFLGLSDQNSNNQGYDIASDANGRVRMRIADASGNYEQTRSSTFNSIDDDAWHHVAFTYGGSAGSGLVYIDANSASTTTNTSGSPDNDTSPNVAFTIGSISRGGQISNEVTGDIDEVRVSNTIRSADWITTEYNNVTNLGSFVMVGSHTATDNLTITEDFGTVTVSVRVDPVDDTQTTTIDFADAGTGTALIDSDFTLSTGTISVLAGENTGTFTFDITNDLADEVDETIDVQISNPSANAKLGTVTSQTYTVTDDDDGSTIDFIDIVSVANEGSSLTPVVLHLNVESGQDISVDYAVTGGDAVSGTDFIALSGTATISAGDLTETISFQPIDDAVIESPETVEITISNPVNGVLGTNTIHTVTIADNDDLGFEGPGGVGDVENALGENLLKLWLIADSVSSSGGSVTSWNNIVQNVSIDYDMVPVGTAPDVVDDAINGHKEISFNNVSDALVSEGALTAASFPGNELSMFVVTETDNLMQSSYVYATDNSETGLVDANSISASIPNASDPGEAEFDLDGDNFVTEYLSAWAGTHSIFTHIVSSDTFLVYRNNGILINRDDANPSFTEHPDYNFYLGKDGTDFFQGDIAEVIMFSRDVNAAQSNLINNYLAAKYNLTITDDFYNFEVSHGVEVAGIGQYDEDNQHVAARAGIVTISNASDLDDGEYVLFGHDNGDISTWTTSEIPVSGISRTAREWRFDNTGAPGTISIAISSDLLPALPSGDEDYVILQDTDGDFSDGATVINTVLVDGQYKASELTITSGDYVTFAIITRTVAFDPTENNGFENTAANATITLSLENSETITLDYDVTGGTATSGVDYSLSTSGTVEFVAGQTSIDLGLGLIDDGLVEGDETIEITLSNPPTGVNLEDEVFTFTINDDDGDADIQFNVASSSGDENVSAISLQVDLSAANATETTTVDYAITGGTAEENPSPDFTFTAGTLTINATETTGTIDFTVLDDVLSESSETIEISLSNPTNSNLGTNSIHTYTITDNDGTVEVEFQEATTTIDEGGSIAPIVVELSVTSGQDVSVNYAVTGGDATGGGVDYTLASGTLTILAGQQLGTINIALTDDGIEESGETVILTLSGEVGATLGTETVHTVTISDNDSEFGYYGPGGVGNSESNMLWLDATAVNGKGVANVSDAASVTTWVDRSGNGNDFTAIGTAPVFDEDAFNLKNTVIISSSAQGLQAPAGFSNALSNYSFLSVLSQTSGDYLVETNTAATSGFRLSQGNTNLYSINDTDYLSGNQSTAEDVATWIFNSSDGTSAQVFRNGTALASDNNFQVMPINNNFALGSRNSDQTQATGDFAGNISEFIMYTRVINAAQRIIVENYLANKYDLTIANDLYAFEGTYGNDIVGIGQNGIDQHLQSMSDSLMMISGASALGDGDYVFAGHDGADDLVWTTSEVPSDDINIQRLAREWRLDVTGTPGTIIIKIDATQLPLPATGYDEYLVWTDEDGDFRSGATTYQVEYSEVFGFHVSDEVTITDGTFIAIGVAQPVVEFTLAASDGDEVDTNPSIEVSLNFSLGEDVTVDFAATGGTATGGNVDYLLASGTLTITAGQTSANISLGIIDDIIEESDETIEITLSTPSSNVALGATSEHTYTIHDDDNPESRTIDFTTAVPGSGTEGDAPTTVSVNINVPDNDVATTVDLLIVSVGNAADETDDFTLDMSTLTFPADNATTTQSFDITIIDDAIFETTELITIQLTNPVNADIGTVSEYTFNITDNDTAPVASFSDATSFVSESAGTAQIEVNIDALSVNDVTVNYTVTATATSGTDYTLADGSLLIIAGNMSENIQPIIVNDLVTESAETVTVALTTATNATVGGTTVHVLTINDDDQAGSTGPGGVGDNTSNLVWLTGDNFSAGTWSDKSGNSNVFSGGVTPGSGADINGNSTVAFTGTEYLETTSVSSPAGDYDVFFVLNASDLGDQVLFSSDDTDDIYLGYNNSQGLFQDVNGWTGTEPATTGTNIVQYNLESGTNMAEYFVNGTSSSSATYTATSISGTQSVGAIAGGSEFLNGDMGEMIIYNTLLNGAQRIIVENYLSSKYGVATANDNFAYDDGSVGNEYQYDLIGIGQVDSDNIHVTATSEDFLTISNPNAIGNGEYLMLAHDNGAIADWTTNTNTPSASAIQRLDKEWRVDMTGDLGSISIQIDTTVLPTPPEDGMTWALLVESADGDFTNGDTEVYPLSFVSGDIMGLDGFTFADGDYFTFAVVVYETVASGDFEDPNTWSTGVVPTDGVSATITGFTVTMNADAVIGSLTIEDTGVLDLNGNTIEFTDGCITLEGSGSVTVASAGSTVGYANPDVVNQCVTSMTYNNIYTDGPAGSTKYLLGDIIVLGDMTIQSAGGAGAIFDAQDIAGTMTDYDISVAGDWDNEIVFNPRSATVTFNGTGNQQLSNSVAGGETFNNMTVNNSGGNIILGSDVSTSGILTLTDGNVVLGGNDLNIDNDAAGSISGGSASSYLVTVSSGLLRQSIALTNTYTFPVGDAIYYSPLTFVLNSGILGASPSITLNLRDDTYAGITEPAYISRYWTLEDNDISGPFGYNVSYAYDDSDVVWNEPSLLATKYQNTSTYTQGGSVNATSNTITSDEYDSFSVHTAQSFVAPLPVELLSFGAVLLGNQVDLLWVTASEIDNDYFVIERSADGEVFEVIGDVTGQGTTNEQTNYSFVDSQPYYGVSYYRLVQIDFDGKMKVYDKVSVNNDQYLKGIDMVLFPNPTSTNEVTLRLTSGDENSQVNVTIYSLTGRLVYNDAFDAQLGTQEIPIVMGSKLESGIYHVKVVQGNNQRIDKLIVR